MTEHNRRLDDSVWKTILKLWPLIVAFISVVAMATTIKNTVDVHEMRISKLEDAMVRVSDNTDRLVDELLDKK